MQEIGYHWHSLIETDRPASELAIPQVRPWTRYWRALVEELKAIHPDAARRTLQRSVRLAGFPPRDAPALVSRPLDAEHLKEVHRRVTRKQALVPGFTPSGEPTHVALHHGEFKLRPNNPVRPDGRVHEWCPWELAPRQIDRVLAAYHDLPRAFPEVRAAWLLHRIIHVHAFEDGNGRVARRLCSRPLLEAGLPPFALDEAERDTLYVPAIEHAHHTNDLRPLVRFVVRRLRWSLLTLSSEVDPFRVRGPGLDPARQQAAANRDARATWRVDERAALATRLASLSESVARWAEARATELADAAGVPVRVHTDPLTLAERRDVVRALRGRGLHADRAEPTPAVRVHLDGDVPRRITLALTPVGRPSPGAATGVVLLQERDGTAWVDAELPSTSPAEPLVVTDEDVLAQRDRILADWVPAALASGLRGWGRAL